MSDFSLRFLTRPGCHLCEEAEPVVRRVAALTRAPLSPIDVDGDAELAVDWGLRIPVVLDPRGSVLAEGRISFWPLLRGVVAARFGS